MTDYSELREYFYGVREHISSINPDFAVESIIELAVFCTYIIKTDSQFTPKELAVIKQITGIPAKKEDLKDIIKRTEWDKFKYNFPVILQFGIVSDLEAGIKLSDSRSKSAEYVENMRLLGRAIANAGGMTNEKAEIVNNYADSLFTKAFDYFTEEERKQKLKSNKSNLTPNNKDSKAQKKSKNNNSETIQITPDLKQFFKITLNLFGTDQETREKVITDITKFCLFAVHSDRAVTERTVTDREAQFLEIITGSPANKETLEELKHNMDFDDFTSQTPFFFDLSVPADLSNELNYVDDKEDDDDSITHSFINYLALLGIEFSEVEGTTDIIKERIAEYCDYLFDITDEFLNTYENYME